MEKEENLPVQISLLLALVPLFMYIIQKSGGLTGNAVGEIIGGESNVPLIIILCIIGIIIVLAIVLFIVLRKKKSSQEGNIEKIQLKENKASELEDEAKKIVLDARQRGYTDKEIADLFRKKGWEDDDIELILKD